MIRGEVLSDSETAVSPSHLVELTTFAGLKRRSLVKGIRTSDPNPGNDPLCSSIQKLFCF